MTLPLRCRFGTAAANTTRLQPLQSQPRSPPIVFVSHISLFHSNAGNHILHVMTTKVPSTHVVLWPYLLELINDVQLQPAFLVIIQCVHELAKQKRLDKANDYAIPWEQKVNIPSPQTILARLMIMGSVPFRAKGLGSAVVSCMASLGPIINEAVGKYWDESMPALLEHLECT